MPNPLKTWIYKVKNFERVSILAILIGILVIIAGWYAAIKIMSLQVEQVYLDDLKNLDVKSFSLNGKVTELNLPKLSLEVGQVVSTNKGNELVYKTFNGVVNNDTSYFKKMEDQTFGPALIEDLHLADTVTIYTSQNPYENNELTIIRIEIN